MEPHPITDTPSLEFAFMGEIKAVFDPDNILNPGKADQWVGPILGNLRYPCKEYM